MAPPALRSVAWALKDECLAAWTADPPRTLVCAQRLAELAAAGVDPEVRALTAWADGIAAMAQGQLSVALLALEGAQTQLGACGQHAAGFETLVPRVMALAMLGRNEEALQCGARARAHFIEAGDGLAAGRVELNLGTLLFRADRLAEAAGMYRSAAVHFARARDAHRSILADIGLGGVLIWQFEFDEALRINQRALRRAEQRGLDLPQGQARLAIGRIELLRGAYHRALRELALAPTLLERAGAPPQQCLEATHVLADAYLAVNLLPEAEALYNQAIAAADLMGAPVDQALALVERARVRGLLGHRQLAQQDLAQARRLFSQAGNRVAVADVELTVGQWQLDDGHAQAAAAYAQAAQEALAGSGMRGWQLEARALAASAAAAQGHAATAAQGHADVLREAEQLGLLPQQVASHVGQGELAWQRGDLRAARLALTAALELVEGARSALPDDEFRAAVAARGERAHDLLVRVLAADPAVPAAELLQGMERGRSRALALGLMAQTFEDEHTPRPPTETRVQFLRQCWRTAVLEGQTEVGERHATELRRLEAELLEAHRQQRMRRGPSSSAAAAHPAPGGDLLDIESLQATMAPGQALVAYHLDGEALLACVVTRHGARKRAWAVPGLQDAIEALRFQIDTPRHLGELLQTHGPLLLARVRSRAQALHALLWAPLADALGDARQIIVVPHRALHYVPWCALHDGTRWCVQRHEFVLAASVATWASARMRTWRPPRGVLALGAAADQLPFVREELGSIAQAMGNRARLCVGAEATAEVLQQSARDADVVHLACHGQFRADNPQFSSLALAGGPLTLHDLREIRLDAALVVLSACETGLSRVAPGDELIGLVRGFMLAGARAVLATQWAVSDVSTARLMGALYRGMAQGVHPAAALRAVQSEAAAAGGHPFHWAALTLYGQHGASDVLNADVAALCAT